LFQKERTGSYISFKGEKESLHLNKFQKNFYPTILLEALSGSAFIYLILTHYHGMKIFYGTAIIVFGLGGYVFYLMLQKRKLREESKRLKKK
jgi:hypothetical protein